MSATDDADVERVIKIMETSALLRQALPEVRRLALIETLRASRSGGGWEEGRGVLLENLETSPYISQKDKGPIAEMAMSGAWEELGDLLRCPRYEYPASETATDHDLFDDSSETRDMFGELVDLDGVDANSARTRRRRDQELGSLRATVASIFSRSTKMQSLSSDRRQRIGSAIHRASTREELLELSLSSLESSEAFDVGTRERVANDILDRRYDLLLLPDRFDCEDVPRLTLDDEVDCGGKAETTAASMPPCSDTVEVDDECPVCLGVRPVQVTTPCGHGFCRECVDHWSVSDFVCPVCRWSLVRDAMPPPPKGAAGLSEAAGHTSRSVSMGERGRGPSSSTSFGYLNHAPKGRSISLGGHGGAKQALTVLPRSFSSGGAADAPGEGGGGSIGVGVTSNYRCRRRDTLTVFQAAPLAWADAATGELHPVEMLDFEREREMLTNSLRDAAEHDIDDDGNDVDGIGSSASGSIDVVFETATTDRLGAFLAAGGDGKTKVLHFSCHGNPDYLCFEDGSGGVQLLKADDLREFVSAGGCELHFVFVSACFSLAVGEAFIGAGARHVLCCQQDEPLMDVATAAFTGSFYRALACGKTLKASFELGRQAVKLSPLVPDSDSEMDIFVLLPRKVDHDVPIFYTDCESQMRDTQRLRKSQLLSPRWILPHPPHRFVGREVDMYKMLQTLLRARLVRVTGMPGVGKRSLVSAVCHYIRHRRRCFSFEEIIWFPPIHTAQSENLSSSFHDMFALMQEDTVGGDYSWVCGTIIEALYETKAVLVIDTNALFEESAKKHLSLFLRDLLHGTKDVRVILIDPFGLEIALQNGSVEAELSISPLAFRHNAILFGVLCPHVLERRCPMVQSPRQLSTLLVPEGQDNLPIRSTVLSKRSIDVFKMIGEGIPAKIQAAAKKMTQHEYMYDKLIEIGERKERLTKCHSRVQLEMKLKDLDIQLQAAVAVRDFTTAREIQECVGEFERLRETLPDLDELKKLAEALRRDLEHSVSLKDFSNAKKLNERLVLLEEKIKREEAMHSQFCKSPNQDAPISEGNVGTTQFSQFTVRAELEAEIRRLEDELDRAVAMRDFALAKVIRRLLHDTKSLRDSMPSASDLLSQITSRNADLDRAVQIGEYDAAERLSQEIKELEKKLKSEKEREASVLSDDHQFWLAVRKGCISTVDHETYIRAIWCALEEAGDATAEGLRSGRQEAFRVVECLDKRKYHVTWTYFWIQMVTMARASKMISHRASGSFHDFVHSLDCQFLLNPNYVFVYYSEDVLARGAKEMVLSDKKKLPNVLLP